MGFKRYSTFCVYLFLWWVNIVERALYPFSSVNHQEALKNSSWVWRWAFCPFPQFSTEGPCSALFSCPLSCSEFFLGQERCIWYPRSIWRRAPVAFFFFFPWRLGLPGHIYSQLEKFKGTGLRGGQAMQAMGSPWAGPHLITLCWAVF